MIDLIDIRYCRIGTDDIETHVRFATEIVGLQLVDRTASAAYVRGDNRHHNICYFKGDERDHTVAFEVTDDDAFEAAAKYLTDAGIDVTQGDQDACADRRVLAFLTFRDPTGNKVDLVLRPYYYAEPFLPTRAVGIDEFSHIGLNAIDPPSDEKFWTRHFNMRVNDWIGPAALMSYDELHHRLALFPAGRPGIQHINFQVDGIDSIMRSWYFLQKQQVKIRFGPGRHPTSSAMFLYFEGPGEIIYEYSHGVRMCPPEWRPRQLGFENESFCHWGAEPQIDEFTA